ncbi:MAG: restriction endonuclease subunit S [Clostridia bacterium]
MSFSEWEKVKLGDVIRFKNGRKKPDEDGDIPIYGGNGVLGFTNNFNNENAVVIGRVGAYCGSVFYENGKCWISDNAISAKPLNNNNVKYIYYVLKSLKLNERRIGTGQPLLTQNILNSIDTIYPSVKEQEVIAATLSCLDDKIELNNRINKNLEEIVKATFKNWFIDFEPFQDGEFEDSELGKIPKGWRVGTIGELISDTLGGDWGKETAQGNYTDEVVCIRGADIPEIASGKRGKPPIRYILKKNAEKKRLSQGQIIIEISGGSPTQSTGRTAFITRELINIVGHPLICTNFCRALSLKKGHYSTFVYSMLQYLYSKDVFFLYENGTTGIKNLDTNNLFNKHLIVLPDEDVMIKYKVIFDTIINSIYQNGAQIDKLSVIRDAVLPKLMSGEIRVSVEEVQ